MSPFLESLYEQRDEALMLVNRIRNDAPTVVELVLIGQQEKPPRVRLVEIGDGRLIAVELAVAVLTGRAHELTQKIREAEAKEAARKPRRRLFGWLRKR